VSVDAVGVEDAHDHPHCPGDDWIACHDQSIYGPCGHENCYGADVYFEVCTCRCHEQGQGVVWRDH